MDNFMNLLVFFSVFLISHTVFGIVDQEGYVKTENRLCGDTVLGTYNHTGTLQMEVADCTTACQGEQGCIAFSVDRVNEICLMFASCETKSDNAVYTTYEAVYCGDPPGIANARATVSSFYYNNAASYGCLSGYALRGRDTISCAADGTWTGSAPTCEYTLYYRCHAFCTNGTSLSCPSGYVLDVIYHNYGSVLNRDCTPDGSAPECLNYESNDYVQEMCNGNNTCDLAAGIGPIPNGTCASDQYHLTEYKCVEPSRENVETCYAECASADVGNSTDTLNYTSEGVQRMYTCDPGYEISENDTTATVLCANGSVSEEPPTCNPINCSSLVVSNGSLSTEVTEYKTSVILKCDEGFELGADQNVSCQADKTWTGTLVCNPVNCSTFSTNNSNIDFSGGTVYPLSVTIQCHTGYELTQGTNNHSTISECQADGTWSDQSDCIIKDCGRAPAMHQNGSINFVASEVVTTYRAQLEYFCDEGFLPPETTITCNESGVWDDTHICTAVECPYIAHYPFVQSSWATNNQAYLSVATVTCIDGYEFLPDSTTTCQQTQQWSPPIMCERVDCGQPEDVDNAFPVMTTNTSFGDQVNYTCLPGYYMTGASPVRCLENRTWSEKPVCEAILCDDPGMTESVLSYTSTSGFEYLASATITCVEGHEFKPDSQAVCESNRTWSPPLDCQKVDCGSPPPVENADPSPALDTRYQAVVTYTCVAGCEVTEGVNTANSTCQADGTWSKPAGCTLINCGVPGAVRSGLGGPQYTNTLFESTVTYQCVPGYVLIGDSIGTCTESKTWSISPPVCELLTCPSLPPGPGQPAVSSAVVGTFLSYSCQPGYNLIGAENITCLDNGTWDYSIPTCEIKNCGVPDTLVAQGSAEYTTTTYGSPVTYHCNEGYLPIVTTHYCDVTGSWNGSVPLCEAVNCSDIVQQIDNGVTAEPVVGQTVVYSCNHGYNLAGVANLTCTAYGNWSDAIPTCQPVDCGAVSTTLDNGNVAIGSTTYTQQVRYTCNGGYLLSGTDNSTCTAEAVWSDVPPTCLAINSVRLVTSLTTSLDCDDYTENSLAALYESAKAELPGQLVTVLQSIPRDQRMAEFINILGISCNSPLKILLEVVVESTEPKSSTEPQLSSAMLSLNYTTARLQLDGQSVGVRFTDVSPSVDTDKTCGDGYYTNVDTLECVPCPKDTFQPKGVKELCLKCSPDYTTEGIGTYGERSEVCKPVGDSSLTLGLGIGVPVGVILLLLLIVILYCCMRTHRNYHDELSESEYSEREFYDSQIYGAKYRNPYPRYDTSFGRQYPYKF